MFLSASVLKHLEVEVDAVDVYGHVPSVVEGAEPPAYADPTPKVSCLSASIIHTFYHGSDGGEDLYRSSSCCSPPGGTDGRQGHQVCI